MIDIKSFRDGTFGGGGGWSGSFLHAILYVETRESEKWRCISVLFSDKIRILPSLARECAAVFYRQSKRRGCFCCKLSRVMYTRRLLVLIRFRGECNAIAQELTHAGALIL